MKGQIHRANRLLAFFSEPLTAISCPVSRRAEHAPRGEPLVGPNTRTHFSNPHRQRPSFTLSRLSLFHSQRHNSSHFANNNPPHSPPRADRAKHGLPERDWLLKRTSRRVRCSERRSQSYSPMRTSYLWFRRPGLRFPACISYFDAACAEKGLRYLFSIAVFLIAFRTVWTLHLSYIVRRSHNITSLCGLANIVPRRRPVTNTYDTYSTSSSLIPLFA